MTTLSNRDKSLFWKQGYLTVEKAVSSAQLAAMRRDFAAWVEESRRHEAPFGEMRDGRARFDIEPEHCPDHPALRRIASPSEISDAYLDVLKNSAMTCMVADLVGPDIRLHHCKINSKLPRTATTVKWHQDFTFDPHSNDDLVTALVFLDDVTSDNGPLQVAPGSHKGPLLSLWQNGVFTGAVSEHAAQELSRTAVEQTGEAGSVCLMHSRLAHASTANNSDTARTLFIAAIAAADAIPLAINAVPSRHAGMLLAGSEPRRIRSTAFEMEIPEVPEGASFFEEQAAS